MDFSFFLLSFFLSSSSQQGSNSWTRQHGNVVFPCFLLWSLERGLFASLPFVCLSLCMYTDIAVCVVVREKEEDRHDEKEKKKEKKTDEAGREREEREGKGRLGWGEADT